MQYKKLEIGNSVIEFHNNWLGEETVIVNGTVVSKKSSIWGTDHMFTVTDNGHTDNYTLTTRVSEMLMVVIDVRKNGEYIERSIPIPYGLKPKKPKNLFKQNGLEKLKKYDLLDSLEDFKMALKSNPKDPEIYFHMACAYSVLEKPVDAYDCIEKAVKLGLKDKEAILNHDMLAYLRIDEAFEAFMENGFKQ